jgi:hypothetical protein
MIFYPLKESWCEFMKSLSGIIRMILILFLVYGLSSCLFQKGRVILVTRDYWWEAYGEQNGIEPKLKELARSENMSFSVEVVTGEDDIFREERDAIIIMDPVVTFHYSKDDQKASGKSILITTGDRKKSLVIALSMDETMELAGRITSDICSTRELNRCVLIYPGSEKGANSAVSSFKKGFDSEARTGGGGILAEARLTDLINKTKARRLFERYSSDDRNIYILMTYSLTPFFLDLIDSGDGFAVVTDSPSGIARDRVIFSVEYNYGDAIEKGLKRFFEIAASPYGKDVHLVESAYIKWGKVIDLPDKYKKEALIVR